MSSGAVPEDGREAELMAIDIEGLALGPVRLEHLVDQGGLRELAHSFEKLFGIPIRILSSAGVVLAETPSATAAPICALVNEHESGQRACDSIVTGAKNETVREKPCFTGAVYRVVPIEYDHRAIGRVVLGPFLPSEHADSGGVPSALLAVDPAFDAARGRPLLGSIPRADRDTIERLAEHVRATLDLVLFSGHKALLTSTMHLASVRESYRELAEKNERLSEAYHRLQEVDRLKSNFLATMSHELRTPLTSILGYSEMLGEGIGGTLNAEQHEFVQTIRAKGGQLLGLIMSLLDLSKLESGTVSMERSEVSIDDVLADTITTVAPTATKKGVILEHLRSPQPLLLYADPGRLRQVFINLSENAIKFTEPGGSVRLVAASAAEAHEDEPGLVLVAPLRQTVEVRVSDTGIGIADSQRARVFDAFYQVDQSSTREYGGTGLGLSIVKRLIDAHGGAIRIENNTPRGTVFVVTLPVGRGSIPPPPRRSVPPPPPASRGDSIPPVFR